MSELLSLQVLPMQTAVLPLNGHPLKVLTATEYIVVLQVKTGRMLLQLKPSLIQIAQFQTANITDTQ